MHKKKVAKLREGCKRELVEMRKRIDAESDTEKREKLCKAYARMVYSSLDLLGDVGR